PPAFRLGGGRSILLSYQGLFNLEHPTICLSGKGERYSVTLGGGRSILLSYGNIVAFIIAQGMPLCNFFLCQIS
ncbi:MAG: hypothetical protein MJ088_06255, partial [Clostridia bacterium]|nr:hypothetical protein [Clostridia bacterium]